MRAGWSGGSSRREVEWEGWRTVAGSLRYDPEGVGLEAFASPRAADLTAVHPGAEPGSAPPPQGAAPTQGPVSLSLSRSGAGAGIDDGSSDTQQQAAPRHALAHLQ
jgi:hypothetical protein